MPYADREQRKQAKRARYEALKQQGICTGCAAAPARPERYTCEACGKAQSTRSVAYNRDHREERNAYKVDWCHANRERIRERVNASSRRWRARNVERARQGTREWYRANRERAKHYALKRIFGITIDQWNVLFESQGKRCAICSCDKPDGRGWATDHDHATGTVRGILCAKCNAGLGMFRDDPLLMQRAARYVVIKGGATKERQAPLINTEAT